MCVCHRHTHTHTHTPRQTGWGEVDAPVSPEGPWVFTLCPVLTGLEVTGWSLCIVGRMRRVSSHARVDCWQGSKGQEEWEGGREGGREGSLEGATRGSGGVRRGKGGEG